MVKFEKVVAASVEVSNASEELRVYNIKATAVVSGGKVTQIKDGRVSVVEDKMERASFSATGESNVNINAYNTPLNEQMEVCAQVHQFIAKMLEKKNIGFDVKEGGEA